ncbi:methylenetetrahydrofolate reductase [Actinopolymorpha sp. B17G11]|uniref:methylenetetrahydrofolate reductase n=1 Tax=Actinopolymorpha sp. B17G11 TaxID=3160861 RepID=UPI0032E38090
MSPHHFQLVCEVEPPTRPDLAHVRTQIAVLSRHADAFLAPDNHIGRATVSSIAVAHEIERVGVPGIACLNSRDRNLLGFRRDLLTAAAYGVRRMVFVYGDKPTSGNRTSDLTVRAMIEEVRRIRDEPAFDGIPPFEVGVAAQPGRPLPRWKCAADFVLTQVSFSVPEVLRWREAQSYDGPVYAGVLVLASDAMATRLRGAIPDIDIPDALIERLRRDRRVGVELACEQVDQIRESGGFDGVHLVSGVRFRQVAEGLDARGWARSPRG